jgi:glutathione synthase/RimK-type ligase-like ATP-grasp enzyme
LSHPQTKVVFEGYEIPFFQEAMELCKKLHYQLSYFFILGWDIAFTPTGPVVIETNNIHMMVDEQKAEGGMKKQIDAYFKEFMENKHKERKVDYA